MFWDVSQIVSLIDLHFALNILMCTISGAIAIKKLRTADPADIFY